MSSSPSPQYGTVIALCEPALYTGGELYSLYLCTYNTCTRQTPLRYEEVITKVLGRNIDAVVVDSEETGKDWLPVGKLSKNAL